MKRRVIALLSTLPLLGACAAGTADGLAVGTEAPELYAEEWANADAGPTLAGLRGMPVLVEFWSKDCSPCLGRIPEMQAIETDFAGRLHVVTIHVAQGRGAPRQDPAVVRAFLERWGITYPVGIPQTAGMLDAYAFHYLPHAVLVDPAGRVVWSSNPASGDVREAVEALLASPGT